MQEQRPGGTVRNARSGGGAIGRLSFNFLPFISFFSALSADCGRLRLDGAGLTHPANSSCITVMSAMVEY